MPVTLGGNGARAAIISYDYYAGNGGGLFQVDTTKSVIFDWYISTQPIAGIGGGDNNHYAGGAHQNTYPVGTATFDCGALCVARFTTTGRGSSWVGEIDLTVSWLPNLLDGPTVPCFQANGTTCFPVTATELYINPSQSGCRRKLVWRRHRGERHVTSGTLGEGGGL